MRNYMKVYHLNILDTKEARDELNGPNGGWSSQPRFTRYADITCHADLAQAALSWLVGEYSYVAQVQNGDLNRAFSLTQNIDKPWQRNEGVEALRDSMRSTSVGDIVEDVDGQLYMVARVGFEKIEPIAMAKRITLDVLI